MLKPNLDYSNTIIYKITCNDTNITDKYVGHTTNFVQRKHAHKNTCVNEKSSSYKCKLYEIIRNNGGWNNWKMEIVDFFNCKDLCEARQKEQEYFVSLNANLNSIEPFPTQKLNVIVEKKEQIEEIVLDANLNSIELFPTQKPNTIVEKKEQNDAIYLDAKFYCKKCEYNTCDKWKFDRHLLTKKHTNDTFESNNLVCKDKDKDNFYNCCCGKKYTYRQGLWKHKQFCNYNVQPNNNDIIQILINENKELRNMVLEVCNKIQEKLYFF